MVVFVVVGVLVVAVVVVVVVVLVVVVAVVVVLVVAVVVIVVVIVVLVVVVVVIVVDFPTILWTYEQLIMKNILIFQLLKNCSYYSTSQQPYLHPRFPNRNNVILYKV